MLTSHSLRPTTLFVHWKNRPHSEAWGEAMKPVVDESASDEAMTGKLQLLQSATIMPGQTALQLPSALTACCYTSQ